jgi:hypothetical protein
MADAHDREVDTRSPRLGRSHEASGNGSGPPPAPLIVTAADAVALGPARLLSARRGARVVLLMGEPGSGKTALIAGLWQQLLEQDGLAGHRLAGSRTALGLERRAHWHRVAARRHASGAPATAIAEAVLLHLRMCRPDGRRVELLISDMSGEQFERVREGRPLVDEIPWASHGDRFAILVDGATLGRQGESEIAITQAQRLLFSLQSSRAVRESARVALVITKADLLDIAGEQAVRRHEAPLLEAAREADPEAVLIRTAAMPAAVEDVRGLGELLGWLCSDDRRRPGEPAPEEHAVEHATGQAVEQATVPAIEEFRW